MRTETRAGNGVLRGTGPAEAPGAAGDRAELCRRELPSLRVMLAIGMALALIVSVFDTSFLPADLVATVVPLRMVTLFGALGCALLATWIAPCQQRLEAIVTAMLLVAGVGTAVIASRMAADTLPLAIGEPMVVALGVYLLSGLPLFLSAVAALPAYVVFTILGFTSGVSPDVLVYATFFLGAFHMAGLFACYRRERDRRDLEAMSRELNGLVNTDRLTGIYNRHMFDDHIARVWRQSRRERHNLSLLIVAIDFMQEFNDRYGYPEGDRCIRRIGEALKKSVRRPLDFIARYDGKRFALVLYDPPTSYIRRLVVAIQTTIAELHIPNENSPIGPRTTVSIGAAVLGPDTAKTLEGVVQFAEEALAESQQRGGDRAVVIQSSDLERIGSSNSSATSKMA
jgi:diguanylate cyclase (GGDEF)-like protein